jgi:3'-phosphoadenosine 5'-phosphosulfate sulfotransferase
MKKILSWILRKLIPVRVALMSPCDNDIILMWCDDYEQTIKMADDLRKSRILGKCMILVLRKDMNMSLLRDAPIPIKELILKNIK